MDQDSWLRGRSLIIIKSGQISKVVTSSGRRLIKLTEKWSLLEDGQIIEKPFFSFVGEKCCNTTILDPQQSKTAGVGLTFQSFVGATFISFVGPTDFVSQQMKSLGTTKYKKVAPTVLRARNRRSNEREKVSPILIGGLKL